MMPESQGAGAELERAVLDRLREHGLLDIAELKVRARHGVAYIEGTVPNLKQKKLAGEVAKQVEGIHDIVNMLRVASLSVVDDSSLKKHIARALARAPGIDESRVSVEVLNSVVHLGGFVSAAAEKRQAEDEAWAAPGVRDIINRIEVLSSRSKSELEVAGEIRAGLSSCLGLDLSKVSVELRDGVAHLQGVVPSAYLKSAAEELARWTPQVIDVVNELTVLSWPGSSGRLGPKVARSSRDECPQSIETNMVELPSTARRSE